jgi:hypothetical protein
MQTRPHSSRSNEDVLVGVKRVEVVVASGVLVVMALGTVRVVCVLVVIGGAAVVVVLASSSESMQRHVRQVGVACLYTASAPVRQIQALLHSG